MICMPVDWWTPGRPPYVCSHVHKRLFTVGDNSILVNDHKDCPQPCCPLVLRYCIHCIGTCAHKGKPSLRHYTSTSAHALGRHIVRLGRLCTAQMPASSCGMDVSIEEAVCWRRRGKLRDGALHASFDSVSPEKGSHSLHIIVLSRDGHCTLSLCLAEVVVVHLRSKMKCAGFPRIGSAEWHHRSQLRTLMSTSH